MNLVTCALILGELVAASGSEAGASPQLRREEKSGHGAMTVDVNARGGVAVEGPLTGAAVPHSVSSHVRSGSGEGLEEIKAPANGAKAHDVLLGDSEAEAAASQVADGQLWCGGHWADECRNCPSAYGSLWCNGDCEWSEGACMFRRNRTWCGGHPADSCDACAWEERGPQGGRVLVGSPWCHGDCYWNSNITACLSFTARSRTTECSGFSPPEGPFKGWGAQCGLWGFHEQWCYVEANYTGFAKEHMRPSTQYPNQSWAPCRSVTYEDLGEGECADVQGRNFGAFSNKVASLDDCEELCSNLVECLGFDYAPAGGECSAKFADGTSPDEADFPAEKSLGVFKEGDKESGPEVSGTSPLPPAAAANATLKCFKKVGNTTAQPARAN